MQTGEKMARPVAAPKLKNNQNFSVGKNGGKRPGAGRKKGGQNRTTAEIKALIDEIFLKIDPVEKAIKLLQFGSDKTQATILLRLLEYRYGKPVQPITGPEGVPIDVMHTIRFGDGRSEF
jgi:hypothetical protein